MTGVGALWSIQGVKDERLVPLLNAVSKGEITMGALIEACKKDKAKERCKEAIMKQLALPDYNVSERQSLIHNLIRLTMPPNSRMWRCT